MTTKVGSRRLILQMGISLDGFVAVPSGDGLTPVMEGGSGLAPEDPELTRTTVAWLWEAGAHPMGRVTFEEMASYWPSSTHDYAAPMNQIPKVVFSSSIERADWPESRIARGEPRRGGRDVTWSFPVEPANRVCRRLADVRVLVVELDVVVRLDPDELIETERPFVGHHGRFLALSA